MNKIFLICYLHCRGMDKEISSGSNEDCDEIDIETEIEDTKNAEVES